MINLIRSDLYRIVRTPELYIALAVSFFLSTICVMNVIMDNGAETLMPGSSLICYSGGSYTYENDLAFKPAEDGLSDIDDFVFSLQQEKSSKTRTLISFDLNYCMIVLIVYAVLVSDLSGSTVKNTLSSAVSRRKYLAAKLITIELVTVTAVFIANTYTYASGVAMNSYGYIEPIANIYKATLYQLPLIMGTAAVLSLAAVIIKKAFIYFAASTAAFIYPSMVYMMYESCSLDFLRVYCWKYRQSAALMWLANFPPKDYLLTCLCIGAFEILICAVLGYIIFNKTELK